SASKTGSNVFDDRTSSRRPQRERRSAMIHICKLLHEVTQRRHILTLLAALCASCLCTGAQQPQRSVSRAPEPLSNSASEQSDLTKDNLDHVAASAILLKEVLAGDPGLMVELKRLVAQEASDNGQLVNDGNLTDDAVYNRLKRDIKFRSVVTRLVQRYGYLVPNVNPNSELGKSQDLLLRERTRRMVQIEDREEADSFRSPRQANGTTEVKSNPCSK